MEELEEGKDQGLPLQISREALRLPSLCEVLGSVLGTTKQPQNNELCCRPQAQQSIVQHCHAAGEEPTEAYRRISAPHCKHALGRSPKAKPTWSKSVWETRNRKDPVVTIKTHFSRQGFCCPGAHSVDRVVSHSEIHPAECWD